MSKGHQLIFACHITQNDRINFLAPFDTRILYNKKHSCDNAQLAVGEIGAGKYVRK